MDVNFIPYHLPRTVPVNSDEAVCAICLQTDEEIRKNKVQLVAHRVGDLFHVFCKECLAGHHRANALANCPICRRSARSILLPTPKENLLSFLQLKFPRFSRPKAIEELSKVLEHPNLEYQKSQIEAFLSRELASREGQDALGLTERDLSRFDASIREMLRDLGDQIINRRASGFIENQEKTPRIESVRTEVPSVPIDEKVALENIATFITMGLFVYSMYHVLSRVADREEMLKSPGFIPLSLFWGILAYRAPKILGLTEQPPHQHASRCISA